MDIESFYLTGIPGSIRFPPCIFYFFPVSYNILMVSETKTVTSRND